MTRAILLDLGNVVLEVDFRRTFRHWAAAAGVGVDHLHGRWMLDDAYRRHETGTLDFDGYIEALAVRLEIDLPVDAWRAGWNALFVSAYPEVQAELARLRGRLPLYAFTNTNPTHELEWRRAFARSLEHFDEIFVSSTIGLRKPDIEAYRHVAAAIGHEPGDILFLDDTEENVLGARRAGFDARLALGGAAVAAVLREIAS